MRNPRRWFREEILGGIGLLAVLNRATKEMASEPPDLRGVFVWTNGRVRLDRYDSEDRRFDSTPFRKPDKADGSWTLEEARRFAVMREWDFKTEA